MVIIIVGESQQKTVAGRNGTTTTWLGIQAITTTWKNLCYRRLWFGFRISSF